MQAHISETQICLGTPHHHREPSTFCTLGWQGHHVHLVSAGAGDPETQHPGPEAQPASSRDLSTVVMLRQQASTALRGCSPPGLAIGLVPLES